MLRLYSNTKNVNVYKYFVIQDSTATTPDFMRTMSLAPLTSFVSAMEDAGLTSACAVPLGLPTSQKLPVVVVTSHVINNQRRIFYMILQYAICWMQRGEIQLAIVAYMKK